MATHLPVKSLMKLNWITSFMTSVLVSTFLMAITHDFSIAASKVLLSFSFVLIISFLNIFFLKIFSTEKQTQARFLKVKFYVCSYFAAPAIWFLVEVLYSLLTGIPWEGEGPHVYQAYLLAILSVCTFNTLIIILQNLVILQHKKAQAEIENLQLKANVSETANLLLRQQIHPHFLFNALTTIKSLYKKDFRQGEDYLVHLANFLRVSISNHTTKTTLLKNEVEFCTDYLKMQKIRFGVALNYSICISKQTIQSRYLPFFSLQPLVENVLKHNDLTEERPMLITINEENGYLQISNNLQPRKYKEMSTGQGLSNLAERYRLLGEAEIVIKSDNLFFTVSIKILDK
jgi:two-component system LytT family sensor kinase